MAALTLFQGILNLVCRVVDLPHSLLTNGLFHILSNIC